MAIDGFMTQVHSPAPHLVGEASLDLITEGDRCALCEAMRRQLLPIPELSEFTVAVHGYVSTTVIFKSLRTAAFMTFGRARSRRPVGDLVGAAFIFAGRSCSDDAEAIRCVMLGRDSFDKPLPIPPSIYEKIQGETRGRCSRWRSGTSGRPTTRRSSRSLTPSPASFWRPLYASATLPRRG